MKMWIFVNRVFCVLVLFCQSVQTDSGYYQLNVVGKDTEQSSTQSNASSSRAVDGDNNKIFSAGKCTHTDRFKTNAWWAVDLGSQYTLHSVGITNRGDNCCCCGDRLNNFTIYGYNDTFDPDKSDDKGVCTIYSGSFGKGRTRTFECTNFLNVRFVGIKSHNDEPLTLCEVYIYVECEPGTFGEECSSRCSEYCKLPHCDRMDGTCPGGECVAGYKGNRMCDITTIEKEGVSEVTFGVTVAMLCVLCAALIVFIIWDKLKLKNGINKKQNDESRDYEVNSYENDLSIATVEGNNVQSINAQSAANASPNRAFHEGYEKINNLAHNTTDTAQSYQELII